MVTIKKNITIDSALYERFAVVVERKGIRFSTFIAAKVREVREPVEKEEGREHDKS